MQFIPFNDWKRENPDLVRQLEEENEDCEICNGDGYCFNCQTECEQCSAAGTDRRLFNFYNAEKDKQIKQLKEWNDAVATAEAVQK